MTGFTTGGQASDQWASNETVYNSLEDGGEVLECEDVVAPLCSGEEHVTESLLQLDSHLHDGRQQLPQCLLRLVLSRYRLQGRTQRRLGKWWFKPSTLCRKKSWQMLAL